MPPVRDPPSGRVPEQGPDWFWVATEACGGGTPNLGFFLGVSIFIGIFGVGFTPGGSPGCPRDRGRAQGGGRASHPRGQPGTLLAQLFYSMAFFWSKNKLRQVSGQLDSVWFSFFCDTQKQGKKQKLTLGSRLIG